jgi:hypothetical protein
MSFDDGKHASRARIYLDNDFYGPDIFLCPSFKFHSEKYLGPNCNLVDSAQVA